MSSHLLFCIASTILVFFTLPISGIVFQWPGRKSPGYFRAGDNAFIQVVIRNSMPHKERYAFSPNVSIRIWPAAVMGNSSLVTCVWCDMKNLKIFFIPIMVGSFHVLITEHRLMDATLRYEVSPGPIYELGGIVSWMDQVHDIVAGTKATVLILPKDEFGNTVTPESEGKKNYNFEVSATILNGSNAVLLDIHNKGWNKFGYIYIEFVAATAGHLLVHIKHKNNSLVGSPLHLTVHPAALDVGNCLAQWRAETKVFQLFSTMETFISQRDKFGNLVPGLYEFDFEIVEKRSKLSLPIVYLRYREVSPGIQSVSFKLFKPGDFMLIITDKDKKKILNMPYEFSIFIGYCADEKSVVNGSGLNNSVAGEVSKFAISLRDAYQYPSPIALQRLQVQITQLSLSLRVNPRIYPKEYVNGTTPTGMLSYGALGPTGMTYVPTVFSNDNSVKNSEIKSSEFDVAYVPEKCGAYEIRVFCGNIPLHGGEPFEKVVSTGKVNVSTSGVVGFDRNASAGQVNFFTVQLMDSFYNPVLSHKLGLKLEMSTRESHRGFFPCAFEDNEDGTYVGSYVANEPGHYELCISYDRQRFLPWPFEVEVHDRKHFPTVCADEVDVWEDQSTTFNVTENDEFFGGDATIVEFQMPRHGALFHDGYLFRYTPYKGYYGYDKFVYTLKSAYGNTGTAPVHIYVRTIPPQFVSSPEKLDAPEDTLAPKFGGFPGFEIVYSDSHENISVKVAAGNGTVSLSPIIMQLWDPMWGQLSVSKVEGRDGFLCLTGSLEVINLALKSLQYTGNANYSGEDTFMVTTFNTNGKAHLNVTVYVHPVNDPPVINVPKFIILENDKEDKGLLIFDRLEDKFNFSIEDPDRLSCPEKIHFRVMFSVEVSSGTFSAKLPAHLISTTELKLKSSKQWQPLLTFVEISNHFTVNKVKGIRFRGTIMECNTLLHQLVYYGDKHDAVLQLRVNDMGWYGCYPDCSEMMSVPLITEATVNLITRTPMNSLVAHSLGSMIIIESIVLPFLAVTLMFFTCKCVILLLLKNKKQEASSQNLQLNEPQNSQEQMQGAGSSENTIPTTGNDSTSFRQSEQPSNLPKPAEETNVPEAATVIL